MFGFDRLAETVRGAARRGPQGIIEAMGDAIGAWRQVPTPHDDETVLIVAFDGDTRRGGAGPTDLSSEEAALRYLEHAERCGTSLELPARLEELVRVGGWMRQIPAISRLTERQSRLLESALHEACANAMEHACGLDPSMGVVLWWSPSDSSGELADGRFILVDQGRSFDPSERVLPNPGDVTFRRRGRGYGLEMIHRIMSEVSFSLGTERGNLTVMRFDPRRMAETK